MLAAIRQWVIKTMTKGQTGVVTTMPKPQLIEMNVQITAERLMRNGINPEDLKTVGQVENVINQIDTPKVNVNPGVTKVKEADVMDMKGNKIDTSKGIMGGEEIKPIDELENYTKSKEDIVQDLVDRKFGKGYFDTVDESEAAIKARIEADNKKGIKALEERVKKNKEYQDLKKSFEDPEEKADGGRIGLLAGTVPKVLKLLKNKKKVQAAVDDIFPTGDYKYDAQMAADALVENNPNTFGGKLYEDLDLDTQMEVYGAVLQPITNNMAKQMQLKKATRPEKTLASMKEGKGIDMSDPGISEEFTRFMKETDPEGYKKLEQTVELSNFDPKGRKKNSDGGRIGLKGGAFLNFIKNMTMNKKSPYQFGKDYLKNVKDKTLKANETGKFMDLPIAEVGIPATTGALVNNQVKKKLEAMNEEQKEENLKRFIMELENDEFYQKYPDLKDETIASYTEKLFGEKKADGGRIGLKKGSGITSKIVNALGGKNITAGELGLEGLNQIYQLLQMPGLYADGGRIGLKAGMTKRAFLKLMGAGVAGIGAVKSGILGIGKGATKQVAKEVAQQTTSSMPPPYFFKLAEKIKKFGDDAVATQDKAIAKKYKDYTLEEDFAGNIEITKKGIMDEPDTPEVFMSLKVDEVQLKGKKGSTKVQEYEEFTGKRDYKGDLDVEPGVPDDILEEIADQAPSIKYASGGLAYMLGE